MLKRFVLTLFSLLLLLIAVLISLLPLLLVRVKLEDATFVWAFCLWAALAILSLIPLSGRVVRIYGCFGDRRSGDARIAAGALTGD